jgi:hypothetical protein
MNYFPTDGASRHRCARCAGGQGDTRERERQLQLLALLEHPDALPADLALRLAGELLVLVDQPPSFRCDTAEEI